MHTDLLQVLEVTTVDSHSNVGSRALCEVRHCFVDVFLWQLFPDGLQGDLQLIRRLIRLRLEFTVLFQHGAPVHISGFKYGKLEATRYSQ